MASLMAQWRSKLAGARSIVCVDHRPVDSCNGHIPLNRDHRFERSEEGTCAACRPRTEAQIQADAQAALQAPAASAPPPAAPVAPTVPPLATTIVVQLQGLEYHIVYSTVSLVSINAETGGTKNKLALRS